jgi:ATP adenylyltransferase
MDYIQSHKRRAECVFCRTQTQSDDTESLIVHRGQRAYVILNRYPYTSGHLMVVSNQHVPSLEDLDTSTRAEMMELLAQAMQTLRAVYKPHGFNLGANVGEAGGAGIEQHLHLHVVPRWSGDTNFMSVVGETRVIPEALEETHSRICAAWNTAG